MKIRKFYILKLHFFYYATIVLATMYACKGESTTDDSAKVQTTNSVNGNSCDSLGREYRDELIRRIKSRTAFYDSVTKNAVVAPYKDSPIDEEIGDVYIQSFIREMSRLGIKNTTAVTISKRQLEMYVGYLNEMKEDSIMLAFGKYDKSSLDAGNLYDIEFDRRHYEPNNRFTLIVGIPIKKADRTEDKFITTFKIGQSKFYDDWQGLWP
ncbi:MAG: hypothetical protein DI535_10330 [Citrobacter freundii]|nr:MAG: hypothetical protein DI535_10330 [Citrobacter freundii]